MLDHGAGQKQVCVWLSRLQALQVTNFGDDLRNGLALGALLAAHWPGENVDKGGAGWRHSRPGARAHGIILQSAEASTQ